MATRVLKYKIRAVATGKSPLLGKETTERATK